MSHAKIEKTIARQKDKIQEGQFYEAHQQLRVIATRYIKASSFSIAIDLLHEGAMLLLRACQGGSGGDLSLMLLDVYGKASLPVNAESRARIITLLRAFPASEPTRKRFVTEALAWSARNGEYPNGDPTIHHVAGTLSAIDGDAREAETHLLLGTRDSAPALAKLEATWYAAAEDPSAAALFAARAVLPYLLLGNLRAANQVLLLFTSNQSLAAAPGLSSQDVSGTNAEFRIYPSIPLLNFLNLLVQTCRCGDPALFKLLRGHYRGQVADQQGWDEALDGVGEMYFGIQKPRQSNPLMDMMSNMFGAGSGGGRNASIQSGSGLPAPAPTPTLD